MSDDAGDSRETKLFFGGILIAIILGIAGNIAVTAAFEIIHVWKWDESPYYGSGLFWTIVVTIAITLIIARTCWKKLSDD
jgi:hypothetical protein